MPEPQADAGVSRVKRAAWCALLAGGVITLLKYGVYRMTDSVAVLSDAMESIINVVAAGVLLYTLWYARQPPDRKHPYGHGKIEFFAVGFEGAMIFLAGVAIACEGIRRLCWGGPPLQLGVGIWFLAGLAGLMAGLAGYIWATGRAHGSEPLIADGKHLMTDVGSTLGVLIGLLLVRWTGWEWLDPAVALVITGLILVTGARLLLKSFHGLMDSSDPEDERRITAILDEEIARGTIHSYHKVRHRHTGAFHWIDLHVGMDPDLTIQQGHDRVSRVEHRIEREIGNANATAHLEPDDAGPA